MEKKERLQGVDLARGLAVLFMIAVHVLEVYADEAAQSSVFGGFIEFLGGPPAAPVFMMLMGLSFSYAKKKDLRTGVLRGLQVFVSGYVLNILRGVLPVFLVSFLDPPLLDGMTAEQSSLINVFLVADILQFAGIALIIMALLREFNVQWYLLLGASLLIALVSPMLWGTHTDIPVLRQFIDLFVGDREVGGFVANMVSFPVFPWLSFPLLGMVIGGMFSKSSDLGKSHRQIGLAGLAVMVAGLLIVSINPEYHWNDYYHSRQGAMIFMMGFVLVWLALCNLLTLKIKANSVFNLMYGWSRDVTSIYFIQWIFMTWLTALFGMNENGIIGTVLIMLFMAVLTHIANKGYLYLRRRRSVAKPAA